MRDSDSSDPEGSSGSDSSDLPHLEPLSNTHDLTAFDSGVPELNAYFRDRAVNSASLGFSSTYAMIHPAGRVIGAFTLAMSSILRGELPSAKLRKGAPEIVPAMLIARMGIDQSLHGRGGGTKLLLEAITMAVGASSIVPVPFIGVHPKTDRLANWYHRMGFEITVGTTPQSLHLMTLKTARIISDSYTDRLNIVRP